MSSKPPIGYIDVRVFAHATEDSEKVLVAVRNLLSVGLGEEVVFEKTRLSGHHGNPIVLFEAKLADKQALPDDLKALAEEMKSLSGKLQETMMKTMEYMQDPDVQKAMEDQGKIMMEMAKE